MDVMVIGLGSMGKRRIRLLKGFEQIRKIVGIDRSEDRRAEVNEKFHCKTYDSIENAMKENEQIQCAFICSSPLSHNSLIAEALYRNLHVFTEINLISAGYEENMALAGNREKVLFLSSTFCYREEIKFLNRRIKKRENLNYVYHIGQYLPDWHPWESYKDFFVSNKKTNGCREIMAIEFPWLIGTFGQVINVNVMSDKISELNIPYKDNYMVQLEHERGNKGSLVIDIVSPMAVRNLEIYGENIYFSWNGTPTGLKEFDEEKREVRQVQLYDKIEHMAGYNSFIVENAYQNEIQEFLDAVEGKKQPKYGFKEDLEVLKIIDLIEGVNYE